jgi:hypothetical protein
MVGQELCETAHADAESRFERRSEISASGPRGARATPELSPQLLVVGSKF